MSIVMVNTQKCHLAKITLIPSLNLIDSLYNEQSLIRHPLFLRFNYS